VSADDQEIKRKLTGQSLARERCCASVSPLAGAALSLTSFDGRGRGRGGGRPIDPRYPIIGLLRENPDRHLWTENGCRWIHDVERDREASGGVEADRRRHLRASTVDAATSMFRRSVFRLTSLQDDQSEPDSPFEYEYRT